MIVYASVCCRKMEVSKPSPVGEGGLPFGKTDEALLLVFAK